MEDFPLDGSPDTRWWLGDGSLPLSSTDTTESCTTRETSTGNESRSLGATNISGVDGTVNRLGLCYVPEGGASGPRVSGAYVDTRATGTNRCSARVEKSNTNGGLTLSLCLSDFGTTEQLHSGCFLCFFLGTRDGYWCGDS